MTDALVYLVAGLCLLLAVILPQALRSLAVSAPMVLVGIGLVIGLFPIPGEFSLDPVDDRTVILHVTELAVLVALMGVGLALDRPLRLHKWRTWTSWSATWRLLAVAMPVSIAAVALLGWAVVGLGPAAALLLGAVLAPTDPVLASDVQVGGPMLADDLEELEEGLAEEDGDTAQRLDEVRFALTSEAGLNDGLAFPFVYLAILIAAGGFGLADAGEWLGWYLAGKVVIGVVVGIAAGWALGRIAFRSNRPSLRLAEQGEPLLALAALLASYGAAELVGGYGFLAVFACAMAMRASERAHDYHRAMHEVIERLERLFTLAVLLFLGIATTRGLLSDLTWSSVLVGVASIFVIRPLAGWVSLAAFPRAEDRPGGMDRGDRMAVAFFGVRGVGSLYYLAYAAGEAEFDSLPWLWSTVGFTIVLSVLVHGVSAKPWLARVDARRGAEGPGLANRQQGG
ncbi:cation transporter [Nocardioides szechwanensis]|uniref:Sodium/proton antiporter, CPA1 family n=1 Tax=Nocardioides szechwanensis TaxID=1005944 RepID=A0A1H0I3B2_9ACTN|nr:cation:proton antiporter [Nocardioides szechwanensis]GEP34368.1 cation transporter [Nocardioides szechwanensis]SDO25571.1 sodium/proton antiporter, CPA1 family [Nocardioides szechwanensis]